MKTSGIKYCAVLLLVICSFMKSEAQELPKGYKTTMEMNADEKGDVTVDAVTKYNAQLWDYIKQSHAIDPSVMKNTLKSQFPKYELTDYEVKHDEMDRTCTVKFKILGLLRVDENGKWLADLDTKNPDITKISGSQFLLIDESSAQTLKINLPKSASNAKVEKDSFGKAALTYNAPVKGGTGNIIKYLGFLVGAGGIFLFFKNKGFNTMIANSPKRQKITYHQPKSIDDAIEINSTVKEHTRSKSDSERNQD